MNLNLLHLLRKLYESDNENTIINTLNGVKMICGKATWCQISTGILPNKLTLRVYAKERSEREKLMKDVTTKVEKIDEEIMEKKL